jgi:hypothetical protein
VSTAQLKEAVILAARAVSDNAESARLGYVEIPASLALALSTALDALDKAGRAEGT